MTREAGWLAVRALLLGALAFSCVGVSPANAASRLCRQLEAELASLGNGVSAGPAQISKYDSAIARQGEEMAKARSRAQRAGCGFSIFGSNIAACATLNASIERMNANLDQLHSERARLARGGQRRDRARVVAALEKHDCRSDGSSGKPTADVAQASRALPGSFASRDDGDTVMFDEETEPAPNGYLSPLNDMPVEKIPRPQGEFHTMCVRTCDGYFFPMSNAATLRDFERDQKNCESSCPGTQMQVFYMRGIGGDPANMTSSVNGRPYRELPNAYLYKKPGAQGAPACGCNAARGFEVIGGSPAAGLQSNPQSPSITSFVPAPTVRPDPAGGIKPSGESTPSARRKDDAPAPPAADRKVRVVAPAFLPDPKAAIDLRAPAPNSTP
jgi:hypothetical protein